MNPFVDSRFWLSWNGACFSLGVLFLLFVVYCAIRWSREDRQRDEKQLRDEASQHDSYPYESGDRQ